MFKNLNKTDILSGTHLSGDVGLRAGVGVQPRDAQLGVSERGTAAPQLLLRARVQLETVLQHRQFLRQQEIKQELLQITWSKDQKEGETGTSG